MGVFGTAFAVCVRVITAPLAELAESWAIELILDVSRGSDRGGDLRGRSRNTQDEPERGAPARVQVRPGESCPLVKGVRPAIGQAATEQPAERGRADVELNGELVAMIVRRSDAMS